LETGERGAARPRFVFDCGLTCRSGPRIVDMAEQLSAAVLGRVLKKVYIFSFPRGRECCPNEELLKKISTSGGRAGRVDRLERIWTESLTGTEPVVWQQPEDRGSEESPMFFKTLPGVRDELHFDRWLSESRHTAGENS